MDIKPKLINILSKENYTFAQLAEYLHMTEDSLTDVLNNKTLELRHLEAISKALRVPLYSFFRDESLKFSLEDKPYYINKLWTGEDSAKTEKELRAEIKILKQIIELKEDQLKKLGS